MTGYMEFDSRDIFRREDSYLRTFERMKAEARNAPIVYRHEYGSLWEMADHVEKCGGPYGKYRNSDLLELARNGWHKYEHEAMEVSARAVQMVERLVEQSVPTYDVCGADVDMGRFFSGEPECMVDYPMLHVSNVGSVITLCANSITTWLVSDENIRKRGCVIAGLAMALNRLGHGTALYVNQEFWHPGRNNERLILRTLVKSPNDFIDPGRILFAYAHPGMQRGMSFAICGAEPGTTPRHWEETYGEYMRTHNFGYVTQTTEDLPKGTIYMPPLDKTEDAINADLEIRMYLTQLGLLPEEDEG